MENSLSFSASKTSGLLFTRKHDYLNKINQYTAYLNGIFLKLVPIRIKNTRMKQPERIILRDT